MLVCTAIVEKTNNFDMHVVQRKYFSSRFSSNSEADASELGLENIEMFPCCW